MAKNLIFVAGLPGCRKSTTSAKLFHELKVLGKDCELCTEFARRDIALNGPPTTSWDQLRYFFDGLRIEKAFSATHELVIVDAGSISALAYARLMAKEPRDSLAVQSIVQSLPEASNLCAAVVWVDRLPNATDQGIRLPMDDATLSKLESELVSAWASVSAPRFRSDDPNLVQKILAAVA